MVGGGLWRGSGTRISTTSRTSNALFTQDIILAELIGIFMDKSQETKDRLAAARILTALDQTPGDVAGTLNRFLDAIAG